MHYREVILEDDKVLGDSGTETFDIDIKDPITELLLKYKIKNDTAKAPNVPPELTISKIEIVDGGQTYLSMTGYEAVAAAAYDKGFWPSHGYFEPLSTFQWITIPLQFGRYVGDPEFGFDPTRLRNPQLKFTWAKNALHLTGNVSLGIIAKVMEGVASPPKVLLYKGVEDWVGGASGVKVVDLWNDYPYRRMLIRSYLYGTVLTTLLSHLKLTCDADKLILFDVDAAEFQEMMRSEFGPFTLRKDDMLEAGSVYRNIHIAGRVIVLATAETAGYYVQSWASGTDYYQGRVSDQTTFATDDRRVQVFVRGDFPHSTYCYQFGRPNDPETWFNAPGFGNIDLKLTEGGLAANSVLVQQPRSLP